MIFDPEKIIVRLNQEIESASFGLNPQELYDPIKYIMQLGGKRLRPLLTLFGAYLFNDDLSKTYKPALSVELFHNFTLMHDDIMDNAPLRRNKPTVHEKWNTNAAILAGDVMLVKAYEYLLLTDISLYPLILPAFNTCASQVCEGQQMDVNFEKTETVTEKQYLEMIRLKTAVLLGFAAELGALLGGGDEVNALRLKNACINMGIAFQLKDDLLDVYGEKEKFGKQVGGDILSNKKTFLLIKALEKANSKQLKELKLLFSEATIAPKEKIRKVTAIYTALNIQGETETIISTYIKKALADLQKVEASFYRKTQLKNYFLKLAQRDS